VSPPNTPISHSQPVSFQYLAGNGPHNLSFDSFSIGQGMDDSLSTYDGSSVMPWGNCHETDIYSISPHYMTPPQQVMVANNSHFTSCTPMYHWPSPGPPIQMTPSNKGPEGANLFVFHIPNHFSNADLWNLFRPYGNVLSVRIMIEKDTGRSRGFGFVSYDVPEAAELAIKNLNGYAVSV
jgi:CUG-BP- and ETR3-like factor